MIKNTHQRVGVFIDVQNLYYSAKNLHGAHVDFAKIVKEGLGDRQLIRAIAYVVRTEGEEEKPFLDALIKRGIETRERDLQIFYGGHKKADWDVGITIDCVRICDVLDVIILVSGDGDYIPLLEYLKQRGRQVEVMAFRRTTSSKLVEQADIFTDLGEDDRFLIKSRRPLTRHTPTRRTPAKKPASRSTTRKPTTRRTTKK
ncbi:MAG: hypothetical protein CMI52_03315 [Parcubacteria group bacterium]|nr:hypothetical protein [Parcubacteria group bacterium]|tara:strand:+ start:175 stop:777 length:603 start_codon:yes stop_codon:yes gene_type:complete